MQLRTHTIPPMAMNDVQHKLLRGEEKKKSWGGDCKGNRMDKQSAVNEKCNGSMESWGVIVLCIALGSEIGVCLCVPLGIGSQSLPPVHSKLLVLGQCIGPKLCSS